MRRGFAFPMFGAAWSSSGGRGRIRPPPMRCSSLMASMQIDYYVVRPRHSPDESFHRAHHRVPARVGGRPAATDPRLSPSSAMTPSRARTSCSAYSPATRCRTDISPRARRGGSTLLAGPGPRYEGVPLVRSVDGRVLVTPTTPSSPRAYGLSTALPERAGRCSRSWAPGRPASRRRCMRHPRGCRRWCWRATSIGGQAGSSSLIRNYLGFSRGVSGAELAQRAYQQAWVFGARFAHTREVIGMSIADGGFELDVVVGDVVSARVGGARIRRLVPAAGRAGPAAVRRRVGVLRRLLGGGQGAVRPGRARGRRRQLGRAGRAAPRPLRDVGVACRARAVARRRACRST